MFDQAAAKSDRALAGWHPSHRILRAGPGRLVGQLDLITRSTLGCAPLPELGEITTQLKASGFDRIRKARLAPTGALYGILAS